jgi:site-specific DNA recombinase
VPANRASQPSSPDHSAARPRVIGYVRVSTEEQTRNGVSLDAQESKIRAYAEAKDLDPVEIIRDEGLSGKDLNRPGIQRVLSICQDHQVEAVIVTKLDRLTRRTRHLLQLVEDVFLAQHIELHSVSESLDTSTPHGRFVLTLFGGLAQMERELVGERTRAALAHKRSQGLPTSHPPLGFRANGKKHRLIPVPEELAIVREILVLWRRGHSYRAIARRLNQDGARTKQGGVWRHATVKKIVDRRDWYSGCLDAA